jgi:hypothetical protein
MTRWKNSVELIDIGVPLISNIQTRYAHRMKYAGHAREIKADADTEVHIHHIKNPFSSWYYTETADQLRALGVDSMVPSIPTALVSDTSQSDEILRTTLDRPTSPDIICTDVYQCTWYYCCWYCPTPADTTITLLLQ